MPSEGSPGFFPSTSDYIVVTLILPSIFQTRRQECPAHRYVDYRVLLDLHLYSAVLGFPDLRNHRQLIASKLAGRLFSAFVQVSASLFQS